MNRVEPATLTPSETGPWLLAGDWTLRGLGALPQQIDTKPCGNGSAVLDGSGLMAMDSAGVWVLQRWLGQAVDADAPRFERWPPRLQAMVVRAATVHDAPTPTPAPVAASRSPTTLITSGPISRRRCWRR